MDSVRLLRQLRFRRLDWNSPDIYLGLPGDQGKAAQNPIVYYTLSRNAPKGLKDRTTSMYGKIR